MNFTSTSTVDEIIEEFNKDHKCLQEVLVKLNPNQKSAVIFDNWTTKDIVAHLAAWNFECAQEIDKVLQNKASWPGRYENEEQEAEFNRQVINKRKSKSWDEVVVEWEQSFETLINRIKQLTLQELNHQSDDTKWANGTPVTVFSLFTYEYEGKGHESGHAKQIEGAL